MRNVMCSLLISVVLVLTGCTVLPPAVVVVTNTPDPKVIQVTVTPSGAIPATQPATAPATKATLAATVANTAANTAVPATIVPSVVPMTPTPAATTSAFPTEVRASLYIAQQDFEHGYMFWISSRKVVWVLFTSPDNPNAGEWQSFPDSWIDGTDPESDPALVPPGANFYQPKRGFGKLWRTIPGVKAALGWGTTPEFALNTQYVYQAGGSVDANNKWIPGPGKHFLTSLSRQTFALSETDNPSARGKWEKVN